MTVHTDNESARALQELLDAIGQIPGSILYRNNRYWEALPPGPEGWVLVMGESGLPEWADPSTL